MKNHFQTGGIPMSIRKVLCVLAVSADLIGLFACSADDPAAIITGSPPPSPPGGPAPAVKLSTAFIWTVENGLQVLPLPYYAESMGTTAINNQGQIVGSLTMNDGTGARAFIWSASEGFQRLGSLVGPDGISLALAIDDRGEVHGLSEGPATRVGPQGTSLGDAFVWTAAAGMKPATWSRFGDLKAVSEGGTLRLPPGAECMQVTGASRSGLAVGFAGVIQPGTCHLTATLMWELDGTPVVIDQCLTRQCDTGVADINNRGEVIGHRAGNEFRWTRSGGFVPIPAQHVSLTAINENGDASGVREVADWIFRPIVWMASGEIRKIELPSGATSGYAISINDKGQVIGAFQ